MMHIHHNPIASGNPAVHSAGAAGKAAALQRATETRRKLMKSTARIDNALDAQGIFMVGNWSDDFSGKREGHHSQHQQNAQPSEENPEANPISVWA